jgi:hypothetical protein
VRFSREGIRIKNARFESCGLTPPHYHLSAAEIDLYQKQGWLVSYWGIFWLGAFPSLPIPVYIYDFNADKKGKKNIMPYPEIGDNADDGSWIRETLSWHLRPDLNGTYDIEYSTHKGTGIGFSADYQIDEDQNAQADLALNGAEGPRTGTEYTRQFGPAVKSRSVSLLSGSNTKQYLFDLRLFSRERINYERVSMLPDVAFRLRGAEFLAGDLEGSLSAGSIGEESSGLHTDRENIYANLSYPFAGEFTVSGAVDASRYGDNSHWVKVPGNLGYTKKINDSLTASANYFHYFINRGRSPFAYENYRFFGNDQVGLGLISKTEYAKLAFSCSYLLPDLAPQDIDYTVGMMVHCFEVDVTYRAMRQEFILGMSLN